MPFNKIKWDVYQRPDNPIMGQIVRDKSTNKPIEYFNGLHWCKIIDHIFTSELSEQKPQED